MTRPLPWLLLLLQAANALNKGSGYRKDDDANHESQTAGAVANMPSLHELRRDSRPGDSLVKAAMEQLSKIPKPQHKRHRQRSGLLSTALGYMQMIIPTGPVAPPSETETTAPSTIVTSGPLKAGLSLLESALRYNHPDALYMLAEMSFFGDYGCPRDLHAAYRYYNDLASHHGNASAQYMLAVYHSTGLADVVPRDQATALLYHTFAAAGGDVRSEMAVAYRYHGGIGTVRSCTKAVDHYKHVADKAIEWHQSGPPGGMSWVPQSWRISDENGGIYGEGASASSAGLNAFRPAPQSDANAAISDVIEYLDLMSQKGDYKASFNLGKIYYDGQRGLDQNLELAKKYFFLVAHKYWRKDGRVADNFKPGIEKTAGKAAGYLGRMYLRGEGAAQNFEKAREWFKRGISHGDPLAYYGYGLMALNGYGREKNVAIALDLFKLAADLDYAPAQVEMGKMYLDQGGTEDLRHANNYFELAARYGNIESHYYIAEMVHNAAGRENLCNIAQSYYKNVAEKAEPLVSSWAAANEAYESGDHETALLRYLLAAEQGYERAQTNVAYMLDSERSRLPILTWATHYIKKQIGSDRSKSAIMNNAGLALIQWTRSSKQANVDATVKMGDYYYYGIGTERDVSKAVQCYTAASDHSQSAQALFNLGWMHENGLGLTQDFHLAKRYYDHALTVNKEAYLPVTLSLLKLRLRSAWNTLTHGEVHSIQDEPNLRKEWSLSEWIANFIRDDGYYQNMHHNDDHTASDHYETDLYDDAIPSGDSDFDEGGVFESVVIIGIMTSLIFLLWWRQRLQHAHQREENERRRQQGLPWQPIPDRFQDEFRDWAAGGLVL